MKKLIFVALGLMAMGLVFAQEAASSVDTVAGMCTVEGKSVNVMIEEWLKKSNLKLGENRGGAVFVAKGTGIIMAPRTKPASYINSRVNAFNKAMLEAKEKMIMYKAGKIKSDTELKRQDGKFPSPLESLQDTVGNAVKAVGFEPEALKSFTRNIVNNLLVANGISPSVADPILSSALNDTPNDPELARKLAEKKAAADKVFNSEEFKKVISMVARTEVIGLQAAFTCEGNGEVGVVVIWSPKLQAMAASLLTGRPIAKSKAKRPIDEQIPTNPSTLLALFGVQQMIDESGDLVLVGYGQAGGKTESKMSGKNAQDRAYANAAAAIREFAGENVAVASDTLNAESAKEFEDSMEEYSDTSAQRKKIQASAEAMNISGISVVKEWQCKHPVTGTTVYGVVCTWSPKQAHAARRMQEAMANPTSFAPVSTGAATTTTTESTDASFSAAGQGCDLDAF